MSAAALASAAPVAWTTLAAAVFPAVLTGVFEAGIGFTTRLAPLAERESPSVVALTRRSAMPAMPIAALDSVIAGSGARSVAPADHRG